MHVRIPIIVGVSLAAAACGSRRTQLDTNKDTGENGGPTAEAAPGEDPAPEADPNGPATSYMPVDQTEPFEEMRTRLMAEKDAFAKRQQDLLNARYDLSDKPSVTTMFRGKAVQEGVRVKLPEGQTFASLATMNPSDIKAKGVFPKGFMPLPHVKQEEGGQVFPKFQIDEILRQEKRDLTRFDVDHDLPVHLLPEFPAPIFLTSRPDLGDVSQAQLVTNRNFFKLFNGILTPKQLNGLRLLVTPFAQQQFNFTDDRRTDEPHNGVTCFDCHANGHTNAAEHLDPTTRPQESRRRLDTPTLRGLNIQRLFGSQRALKTIEDFTQFEQIGAYFDGDPVIAHKKGLNILDRNLEVADMGEFQALLDFPPAPKLDIDGRLNTALASDSELRGQAVFLGKGKCASCHVPPYYTDNLMHDLKTERFFKPEKVNGRLAKMDGPIKTFPLRGIKESPPYLHDGRLMTLDDSVEFFNLVLGLKLTEQEKKDLVAFMLVL